MLFGDFGEYKFETSIQGFLFVIWSIAMPVVFMNLLIAFFSDTYTRVYEQKEKASYAEMAMLIQDLELLYPKEKKVENKFLIYAEEMKEEDEDDDIAVGIGQKITKVGLKISQEN